MNTSNKRLRTVHELFFSLNIALAAFFAFVVKTLPIPAYIRLQFALNHLFGQDARDGTGQYLAFFLITVLLAMLLFLPVRGFSHGPATEGILTYIAGFTALGIGPACWCYIAHPSRWEGLEVLVYLAFLSLFLVQRWPLPLAPSVLIVSVHYGFWCFRFWKFSETIFSILVPVLGLCSFVLWAAYMSRRRAYAVKDRQDTRGSRET